MSPTLIIITDDENLHYEQTKTGQVKDINKIFADLLGSIQLNVPTLGSSTLVSTRTGASYWTSTDIPF